MSQTSNHVDKFYSYLNELDQGYTRLVDLLRQKLAAVEKNDLVKLDDIIKQEQVYVLLSKGFDGNLKTHRQRLNLKGETLGDVIEEMPADHRDEFRLLHRRLKATLEEVQVLNTKCQSMIQDRLYTLDRNIKELDKSDNSTYKKGGQTPTGPQGGPGLFTKSV